MKISLFDTIVSNQINNKEIDITLKFLIENRSLIILNEEKMKYILNNIPKFSNNISTNFINILESNNYSYFTFINTKLSSSPPNLLLYNYINLDLNYLKHNPYFKDHPIHTLPEFKNKIIVNLNQIMDVKITKILDVNQFNKIIMRTLCTRSYNNFSNVWISGSNLEEFIKLYASPLSNNIARLYNLDYNQILLLSIIFSYFYISRCIEKDDDNILTDIVSRYSFNGTRISILDNIKLIQDLLQEKYNTKIIKTIEQLIYLIVSIFPKRMRNLNLMTFNSLHRTFSYNPIVSIISIEYPGYWLYNIFSVADYEKSNLYFTLNRIKLLPNAFQLSKNLISSNSFIKSFDPIN